MNFDAYGPHDAAINFQQPLTLVEAICSKFLSRSPIEGKS